MFERLRGPALTHVFVERSITSSPGKPNDCRGVEESFACFDIHEVRFVDVVISEKGDRIICHFTAPDVESVRLALRGARLCCGSIWIKDSREDRELIA